MKRSEMAKILEERFEQIGLNITPAILAESVLRMIEDAGMQPPKRFCILHYILNINSPSLSNTWEPETE